MMDDYYSAHSEYFLHLSPSSIKQSTEHSLYQKNQSYFGIVFCLQVRLLKPKFS